MCAHCVQMRDDYERELAEGPITEERMKWLKKAIQECKKSIWKNKRDRTKWRRRLGYPED